jgi:MerR family redox-sensitive transcriptional activator SoxR
VSVRTISQAAREVGLRPSAIRYYEQIGILPAAPRVGGQRRYDETALHRLAVIQRSRKLGFTLEEIKALFFSFPDGTPPSRRWKQLADNKLEELRQLADRISDLQSLLRGQGKCACTSLDECGKWLAETKVDMQACR